MKGELKVMGYWLLVIEFFFKRLWVSGYWL